MEGNGSNFGPFLSSRTRPGRAHDAFWKLGGARRDTKAAFRRGVPRGCPSRRSVGPEMVPQPFDKVEFAPGNGMAPAAPDPQYLVLGARRQGGPMLGLNLSLRAK